MSELEQDINTALNANVELSKEEYAEMCKQADETTKVNGVEGKAAISEAVRHKRVQTNFYATALNILVNLYQLTAEIADSLKELKEMNNGTRNKDE